MDDETTDDTMDDETTDDTMAATPPAPVTVHIVAHTHWDREWYDSFQGFRLKLVPALDALFGILETEPGYRFTLDGQTAMIDDYLAVRPERAGDFRRYCADGRLAVGPWTTLIDEFLVSGETIVRNLELGRKRAADFGEPMPVAYLPDMFGHTAQMPQILTAAGLDRTVLWRGVPRAVDNTFFRWRALDGSEILVAYLVNSYSNAVALPLDPETLLERARALIDEQAPFSPPGHVLAMNGTDHWPPQSGLADAVEKANALDDDIALQLGDLPGYFDATTPLLDRDSLPVVEGELRSGARSNVLMGVTSTRTDLKRIQARAERILERYAEPLLALTGGRDEHELANIAWQRLILNAAHDSVCSCSSDETMLAVEHRYREAATIAAGLRDEATKTLSENIDDPRLSAAGGRDGGVLVWNPSPFARSEVLEVEVPVDDDAENVALEAADGTRVQGVVTSRAHSLLHEAELSADQLMSIVPIARTREFGDVFINTVDIDTSAADGAGEASGGTVVVRLLADTRMRGHLDVELLKRKTVELAREYPAARFRFEIVRPSTAHVLVRSPEVAPLGWQTLVPVATRATPEAPPLADANWLDNGRVRVDIADDGTFSVTTPDGLRADGCGHLVDSGDAGDTYNYSPPDTDRVVDAPESVEVEVVEATPLRGRIRVRRRYRIPAALTADETARSDDLVDLEVAMTLALDSDSETVDVDVEFDNCARDHRLRVEIGLPRQATSSHADVAFGVVERGLDAEGSKYELPLPTWPAKRFADAGGLAALFDQTTEYEITGDGTQLALTLVRSTGFLSRAEPALRPNPAGPTLAVEHAQSIGTQRLRFGILVHSGDWREGNVAEAADRFAHPLTVRTRRSDGTGERTLPAAGAPFDLDIGTHPILSSLRRNDDEIELRFVNASDTDIEPCITPTREYAAHVGIRDSVAWRSTLSSWQIATVAWLAP